MKFEERMQEARRLYKQHTVEQRSFAAGVFAKKDASPPLRAKTQTRTRRRALTIVATAMVLLMGLFGTGFASAQVASAIKQIPLIGKAFNLLQNAYFGPSPGIKLATKKGFSIKVNQSATDQGITLTIGNAYCEKDELAFDMVESFADDAKQRPVIREEDMKIDIDGKRDILNFSGGQFEEISGIRYGGVIWDTANNMTPYAPFPDSFTLNVHISKIGNVKGNWNFSFPMSRSGTNSISKEYYPNVSSKTYDGMKMTIQDIFIAPSETKVNFELRQSVTMKEAGVPHFDALDTYDQNGNRKLAYVISAPKVKREGNENVFELTAVYHSEVTAPTSLTFVPNTQRVMEALANSYPIVLNKGLRDEITITKVEYLPDKTLLHLQTKGDVYKNTSMTYAWLYADDMPVDQIGAKIENAAKHAAVLIFPKLDPKQNLVIETSGDSPIEGLSTVVNLK